MNWRPLALAAVVTLGAALLGGRSLGGQSSPADSPASSPADNSAAVPASRRSDPSGLATQLGCPVCHGRRGEAPLTNIPSLAAQRAAWLQARLEHFRHLGRTGGSGIMPRYAHNLTDAQIRSLAQAFSQAAAPVPPRMLDASLVARGQTVFEQGRPASGIIACANCHGPTGSGTAKPLIPALMGQHAGYVIYQLGSYRHLPPSSHDPEAQAMRTIARSLSDADIRAVAAYIEQLPSRSFQ